MAPILGFFSKENIDNKLCNESSNKNIGELLKDVGELRVETRAKWPASHHHVPVNSTDTAEKELLDIQLRKLFDKTWKLVLITSVVCSKPLIEVIVII